MQAPLLIQDFSLGGEASTVAEASASRAKVAWPMALALPCGSPAFLLSGVVLSGHSCAHLDVRIIASGTFLFFGTSGSFRTSSLLHSTASCPGEMLLPSCRGSQSLHYGIGEGITSYSIGGLV
jgi:hypothetical protein